MTAIRNGRFRRHASGSLTRGFDRIFSRMPLLIEGIWTDRSNQSVVVPKGFQKNRNPAAKKQRAVMRRFMVIAIEKDEIVFGDQG